jgi:hypothetical protein
MKKKPESFVRCGAISILMRHAIEQNRKDEANTYYSQMLDALRVVHADMKKLGIARMVTASAEISLDDAIAQFNMGNVRRGWLLQMVAHDLLRKAMAENGFESVTDDEILEHHKAIHEETVTKGAVVGATLKTFSVLGNQR